MMHINLNPHRDPEFWQFTFQNMSRYDLPAAFSYICNVTGYEKIDYIGHSQGSMIMFIALADKNQAVISRLNHYIAWGPVMYVENITSTVFESLAHSKFYEILAEYNINNVFAYNWLYHPVMIKFCNYEPDVCRSFLGPIADANPRLDNASRMDVVVGKN
jgi:gastric triacylglycerol lipase